MLPYSLFKHRRDGQDPFGTARFRRIVSTKTWHLFESIFPCHSVFVGELLTRLGVKSPVHHIMRFGCKDHYYKFYIFLFHSVNSQ